MQSMDTALSDNGIGFAQADKRTTQMYTVTHQMTVSIDFSTDTVERHRKIGFCDIV
jgi:hypothetical protein